MNGSLAAGKSVGDFPSATVVGKSAAACYTLAMPVTKEQRVAAAKAAAETRKSKKLHAIADAPRQGREAG